MNVDKRATKGEEGFVVCTQQMQNKKVDYDKYISGRKSVPNSQS